MSEQLYIGGEWRAASGGATLEVADPATGEPFAEVADATVEDLGTHLRHALTLDVPSVIVLPIDYSIDVAISEELGTETVST